MIFSPNEKPFTVISATAFTEATGTQFTVTASETETEIVLANGKVTVSSEAGSVTLAPGERSLVPLNQPPSQPERLVNLTDQLSWTGLLVFHNSPLESVAAYLSQYFNSQIEIAPTLKDEAFKASFDPDTLSLHEAFDMLTLAFNANIDTVGQNAYLITPLSRQ